MHSRISVGLIGFGRSGHGIHARAIAEMPHDYFVAAIYDPLPERRSDERWPEARPCSSVEELLGLADVELVIVASPNRFHASQALQALKAGKHVLCEKPFGFTLPDVDAMMAAAEASGKTLQPFQQRRYEPDFLKVKEICDSGLLGRITFIRIAWGGFGRRWDWQTTRAFGGGQLYNNGPHPLDHAMLLRGEHGAEPEVWCDLRRSLASGDAEDEIQIMLTAPGSPTVQIDLLATSAFPLDRWQICGTSGGLRGNADRLDWKWVDWSTLPERPLDTTPTDGRTYNSEPLTWKEGSWSAPLLGDGGAGAAPGVQPVLDLYSGLWKSIREGRPQEITPASVRTRVAILQKCFQQHRIPFPDGSLKP